MNRLKNLMKSHGKESHEEKRTDSDEANEKKATAMIQKLRKKGKL